MFNIDITCSYGLLIGKRDYYGDTYLFGLLERKSNAVLLLLDAVVYTIGERCMPLLRQAIINFSMGRDV